MTDIDQTRTSFGDKWRNNPGAAFTETVREGSTIFNWILGRNGFDGASSFSAYLSRCRRILDAGCGNGRVTALLQKYAPANAEIVGADLVASGIARANMAWPGQVSFVDADLLEPLSHLGRFDFIYCQEVLHHTADPEQGFRNLCDLLLPGGEIAIYVYKKKAPVREFVDDFVRGRISGLDYAAATEVSRQITEFGRALADLDVKVTVPDLPVLEIKGGEYEVQRLVYHFFMKCFWNPELSHADNVAINYDWYHPQLCTRHTMDEVTGWFRAQGLEIVQSNEDFYGITMRGARVMA